MKIKLNVQHCKIDKMETKNFNNNVKGNNSSTISNSVIPQNSPQNIDWNGTPWMERKPSCPDKVVTIGTSCSGIGTMEYALQKMGVKTRIEFAGDIDSNVKKSYFANYDITEDRWHDNMFTVDTTKYKDRISIFMAGICCTTFSRAGLLRGVEDDTKGKLFKAFCRIVNECSPKTWVLENVDNMLSSNGGRDWRVIKGALDELGYDLHYQVLNALDYGVPQNRNRLFVIGFREPNPDFKFPAPIRLEKSIRDILEDDTPAFRKFTPRETLRLQGFSDDFKIAVPNYAVLHQAGNSIAVPVLKAIFSQMDITQYGF